MNIEIDREEKKLMEDALRLFRRDRRYNLGVIKANLEAATEHNKVLKYEWMASELGDTVSKSTALIERLRTLQQ